MRSKNHAPRGWLARGAGFVPAVHGVDGVKQSWTGERRASSASAAALWGSGEVVCPDVTEVIVQASADP